MRRLGIVKLALGLSTLVLQMLVGVCQVVYCQVLSLLRMCASKGTYDAGTTIPVSDKMEQLPHHLGAGKVEEF